MKDSLGEDVHFRLLYHLYPFIHEQQNKFWHLFSNRK